MTDTLGMLGSARGLAPLALGVLLVASGGCHDAAAGSGSAGATSATTTGGDASASSLEPTAGASSDTGAAPSCPSGCFEGESCVADGVCACAREPEDSCPPEFECGAGDRCFGPVWPNRVSQVNSDPWIRDNHQAIRRMRPRVLALNFVNARTNEAMVADLDEAIAAIREGSRFHGYGDPKAPAFLECTIAYAIDLRDDPPPPDWAYNNSTRYPREDPVEGYWGFDYERLFSAEFAAYYGIEDPDAPGEALRLCELFQRGLVHEVWVYGDADVPDVGAAEVLELKPRYDAQRKRTNDPMSRCAGNGCFDEEDVVACGVTVRIAWFNNTRGPGCFMESLSHGLESTGAGDPNLIPYLYDYFPTFAGLDLGKRYGVPFQSWYACPYGQPCVDYPSATSAHYKISPVVEGTLDPFDPVCGNVHWPPNGRQHYDLSSPHEVMTTCAHYRDGTGESEPYTSSLHQAYAKLAPDCMGPFIVWWRQNIPGLDNDALDDGGQPMLNWWPFLFY